MFHVKHSTQMLSACSFKLPTFVGQLPTSSSDKDSREGDVSRETSSQLLGLPVFKSSPSRLVQPHGCRSLSDVSRETSTRLASSRASYWNRSFGPKGHSLASPPEAVAMGRLSIISIVDSSLPGRSNLLREPSSPARILFSAATSQ